MNPRKVDDQMTRTLLHKLTLEVELATKGSCLRWNVEPVERVLEELRELVTRPVPGKSGSSHKIEDAQKSEGRIRIQLSDRFERAYQSYVFAASKIDRRITDKEAYDWLKDYGLAEYELPPFGTWQRYVREGRKHHGDQKNTPRGGRTARSAVSSHELDPLRSKDKTD
jgi:hypothetical protein